MKHYNDLRDYHNQKFMQDNFTDFTLATINTFMLQICNNMNINNPIITLSYITIIGEIYAIEAIRNKIIFSKLDLRKIINQRNNIYNEILNNIIKYIREKGIKDPINIMHFLHDTIFDGYLSYNKKFRNMNPHDLDLKLSPFQVILGKGVCRNINILTTDIFKKLNYKSIDIFCTEYKQDQLSHVITKVKYNNEYYYLDTQNNTALELKQNILFIEGIPSFEPINIKKKIYDNDAISLLINYYQIKRNTEELLAIIHDQEENRIIEQIEKLDNIEPNQIYKQNKQLYKKFKKTYL